MVRGRVVMLVPKLDDGGKLPNPTIPDGYGVSAELMGGYVHNGCEVDVVQTDATYNVFRGANLYGDGVATWSDVGITDWDAHINGTNNVWVQWEKAGANEVCHVKAVVAYDVNQNLTEGQYNQLVRWAGDPTCGNGFIAYNKDLALAGGELIQLAGGEQIELS